MKKILLILTIASSTMAHASWWGNLSGGSRAAIITSSALLLGSAYGDSEHAHQKDLARIDRDIRRGYERQAVIDNANRKYSNMNYNTYTPAPVQQYQQPRGGAKVIFSDGRTQILEMSDGRRITINQ